MSAFICKYFEVCERLHVWEWDFFLLLLPVPASLCVRKAHHFLWPLTWDSVVAKSSGVIV